MAVKGKRKVELKLTRADGTWAADIRFWKGNESLTLQKEWVPVGIDREHPAPRRGLVIWLLRIASEKKDDNEFPELKADKGTLLFNFCDAASKDRLPTWCTDIFGGGVPPLRSNPWDITCGRKRHTIRVADIDEVEIMYNGSVLKTSLEIVELLEELKGEWQAALDHTPAVRLSEAVPPLLESLHKHAEGTLSTGGLSAAVSAGAISMFNRALRESLRYSRAGKIGPELHADPFAFDGLAVSEVYVGAHKAVKSKADFTTTLPSDFWKHDDLIGVNLETLRRNVTIRRVFVLSRTVNQEVRFHGEMSRLLGRHSGHEEVRQQHEAADNIMRKMSELEKLGCSIKVAYAANRHKTLRPSLNFDPLDSELAFWDDSEVHIYSGRLGQINGVRVYNRQVNGFDELRHDLSNYFESLWNAGVPYMGFFQRLIRSQEEAEHQFEYSENVWKLEFERGLSHADKELKHREEARLVDLLKRSGMWGKLRRYLDIGFCTGRYPLQLREAVQPDGEVIGIDKEPSCKEFAEHQRDTLANGDTRIKFFTHDFIENEDLPPCGPFDCITSMMGTIAHFGCKLKLSLQRLSSLLAPDGVVFLTRWTDVACQDQGRALLGIYSPYSKERLAAWNPSQEDLVREANEAGLTVGKPITLEGRLELYVIAKNREILTNLGVL